MKFSLSQYEGHSIERNKLGAGVLLIKEALCSSGEVENVNVKVLR